MALGTCCGFVAPAQLVELPKGQTDHARLLVMNQGDATLTVVDPATQKVVILVREGVPTMVGHEVAVSKDGRTAYLPLYGDSGLGKAGTDGDAMLAVDLGSGIVKQRMRFERGVRPHCPVLDAKTGLLYVTTELLQAISIMDTRTMAVVGMIPTGAEQSHMLVISSDGTRGYTANVSTGTVSVLDLPGRSLIKKLQIAPMIQRISISPNNQTVVTADQTAPRLAFVNTRTMQLDQWMLLPSIAYGTAFSPDGKTLLVTLIETGKLAVVDVRTHTVTKLIDVGPRPQAVVFRTDGREAYVSCFGSNYVAVVDLTSGTVTGKIVTGQKADGMAWVP